MKTGDIPGRFFGLSTDEWEAAREANEWPNCPWNGERLTDDDIRWGIAMMLRRTGENNE